MRRPERELKNRETITAMLEHSSVGRIATVNSKRYPVIKAVNFLYLDGQIYFHSSTKGEKIEDIERGSAVCFEVDEPIAYVVAGPSACKASYYYRSILVKGKAALVKDRNKKMKILEKMMEKTAVIEILIKEITGKENLG
jgi:nitroimidazol reductase NimA-like FMN-containing flavoprotein (pyridoxamine 5'-phosphate oxidase superfamily)